MKICSIPCQPNLRWKLTFLIRQLIIVFYCVKKKLMFFSEIFWAVHGIWLFQNCSGLCFQMLITSITSTSSNLIFLFNCVSLMNFWKIQWKKILQNQLTRFFRIFSLKPFFLLCGSFDFFRKIVTNMTCCYTNFKPSPVMRKVLLLFFVEKFDNK